MRVKILANNALIIPTERIEGTTTTGGRWGRAWLLVGVDSDAGAGGRIGLDPRTQGPRDQGTNGGSVESSPLGALYRPI